MGSAIFWRPASVCSPVCDYPDLSSGYPWVLQPIALAGTALNRIAEPRGMWSTGHAPVPDIIALCALWRASCVWWEMGQVEHGHPTQIWLGGVSLLGVLVFQKKRAEQGRAGQSRASIRQAHFWGLGRHACPTTSCRFPSARCWLSLD